MKKTNLFLAMATLVLATPYFGAASAAPGLKVMTHTASDAGFAVSSHLIVGERDAVLVDAQFTRSEARKVSKLIRQSGRRLTTIFITHGHPDHYFGLEILTRDFPEAKVLATAAVVRDIKATAQAKIDYWKKIYKEDLTSTFVVPAEVTASTIDLEGESLRIIELSPAEAEHSAALYIRSLSALVAGDALFHRVHLWLAENRPESWLAALGDLQALGPIHQILPGHGLAGTAALFDENRRYIEAFVDVTKASRTKVEALARLQALFPDFRLPIIAQLSVDARMN